MTDDLQFNDLAGKETTMLKGGINGQDFKALFDAGMTWLRTNHQLVNSLNVFPVPDGDTGTNMLLTMQAAMNEVQHSGELNIGKMAHSLAKGALLGARGNSGVILSQIWRGFARSLDSVDLMDINQFVGALHEARNTAYKGVVRPVEGTILTVIKDMASAAEEALKTTSDLKTMLEVVVSAADKSVRNTPELLPVLKQAGVVDSGGKGLYFIFDGIARFLNNQPLDTAVATVQPLSALSLEQTKEEIEPGQDYEVVIDFKPYKTLNLEEFYSQLSDIGTSIQIGEGDGMYRMHIHVPTDRRYDPIDYTMSIGTVTKVNMENLLDQMNGSSDSSREPEIKFPEVEPGNIAVIVVSPGTGISRIFASLGAAGVVHGGQTMNPSTEEILHAFENLPTDKIIILPNNKNIILAAQTAVSMSVKKVAVIPSKNVPQGLSALLRLIPDGNFEQNVKDMNEALSDVETCEITQATRSVEINGVHVKEGEVIGLLNGKLVYSSDNLKQTCLELLKEAGADERERITFFYGNNISEEEVNAIVETVQTSYPNHELEVHLGGQPHYQFIIAVE